MCTGVFIAGAIGIGGGEDMGNIGGALGVRGNRTGGLWLCVMLEALFRVLNSFKTFVQLSNCLFMAGLNLIM